MNAEKIYYERQQAIKVWYKKESIIDQFQFLNQRAANREKDWINEFIVIIKKHVRCQTLRIFREFQILLL